MVIHGEQIDIRIKLGKIQDIAVGSNTGNTKKSFGSHQKKKEGESSAVYPQKGKGRYPDSDHQIAVVTIPMAPPQCQSYTPRQNNQQKPRIPLRKFDALPMTYAELFPQLLKLKLIELRT